MPAAVTYTFAPSTLAQGSQVNTNFSDLVSYINSNVILKDASVAFTNVPSGPATDPSSDNHLVRKEYIDGMGIVAQQALTTTTSPYTTDGLTDFALNNVPVKIGYLYAIHLHSTVEVASVDADAQWAVYLRVNGVNYDTLSEIRTGVTGIRGVHIDSTVYWAAPATAATDDFTVYVDEVVNGADIQFFGSATKRRTLTITSLGPIFK